MYALKVQTFYTSLYSGSNISVRSVLLKFWTKGELLWWSNDLLQVLL